MKIDCYISEGCTSEESLKANLNHALHLEKVDADVKFQRIGEKEAISIGLKGSPSILIDGVDIMPAEIVGFS